MVLALHLIMFSLILAERETYTLSPVVSGLSDRNGQLIHMNNIVLQTCTSSVQLIRKFSKSSMNEFMIQLSYETWNDVFTDQDVDTIFNFLNIYLRIIYSSFPRKEMKIKGNYNPWMTRDIRVSCNDPNLKYYKNYCKILLSVITAAKNLHYSRLI
jgi:hypothetical protein